jgi:hypothetical protein
MIAMRLILLAAAFWLAASAAAQDPALGALQATLTTLRSHAAEADPKARGAIPELTLAKHQLRDWIEAQLRSLKHAEPEKAFSTRINETLKRVAAPVDDENLLGALAEVRISRESGLLIVTTGVGILCGYDESAYGYRLTSDRWQRIWESEQNDYSGKKYAPQQIEAVHVWQPYEDGHQSGPPFVMTLGYEGWCTSNWHPVYYRVWRAGSLASRPLIDESEFAYQRTPTFLVGSIAQATILQEPSVDVLIEFTRRSIDGGTHNREGIRHYLIDGNHVRRVDPVALSPRDFVDEWLTRRWNESARWSAPDLRQWHRKLHADFVAGEFAAPTMHCQTPDLWQVALAPQSAKKRFEPEPEVFFLIRWRPPYHFTMVDIGNKPWPRCHQEDPEADEWRTLFPIQEWLQ